jgi:hypothetical protein
MALFKLVSRDGEILGTIGVPESVKEALSSFLRVSVAAIPEMNLFVTGDAFTSSSPSITHFSIARSYSQHGAVMLDGISLEDFEKLPDCWFSPSAAYIRAHLKSAK